MNRYRHEYKYLLNSSQECVLRLRAFGLLEQDSHVREDGTYVVRSLYFDDYEDTCLFENESFGFDIIMTTAPGYSWKKRANTGA